MWMTIYIYSPTRRVEFFSEWSNRVVISVYCKALWIWIELSVAVKRMYVNNNKCDLLPFKIYFVAIRQIKVSKFAIKIKNLKIKLKFQNLIISSSS